MERLQIDEQLRQIGGGPRAPTGRPDKDKTFVIDNGMGLGMGMGSQRGGKPFGRGGRGRRGPTFASGTSVRGNARPHRIPGFPLQHRPLAKELTDFSIIFGRLLPAPHPHPDFINDF